MDLIQSSISQKTFFWINALNFEGLCRSLRDPDYLAILNKVDHSCADGMSIVWLSHLIGKPIKDRICGADIARDLLTRNRRMRVSIIGGTNKSDLLQYLTSLGHQEENIYVWPGVYVNTEEINNSVHKALTKHQPDLVFIALGVPKQDYLCSYLKDKGIPATVIPVGGAFDFLTGLTTRAPNWLQRVGLEWFFRLIKHPKRLWKRYVLFYPLGVLHLVGYYLKKSKT